MPTRDGPGPDHEELLLLWSARRTGVLDALTTTAGTADGVAAETELDRATAARFVRTLADYGYLRRVGEEYEPTNRALGFLATRDVRSIGATPRALDLLDSIADLGAEDGGSRDDAAGDADEPDVSSERLRHRLGAQVARPAGEVRAGVTAAVDAAPDAERVVDVYGGAGRYAAEFARRGHGATLVDSARVLDAVGPMLAGQDVETVVAERATAVPVDNADLAVLAGVVQRRSPESNRALLRSTHDALGPGGAVVVLEPLRGRSARARRVAVERLAVGRGDAYAAETVEGWLDEAGFVDRETRDVSGTDQGAVVGRRERGVD
ncbi:methyltransferase domain-containing protein [Salinigranum marinum]|uniref:methyltransferase domain-containing protein n=1 Tax=Salinigranum marinum TaxID=1515595 RepID=UPI002989B261|nr:methyltransferase domain-containing protein [Salinigranum marinum]